MKVKALSDEIKRCNRPRYLVISLACEIMQSKQTLSRNRLLRGNKYQFYTIQRIKINYSKIRHHILETITRMRGKAIRESGEVDG